MLKNGYKPRASIRDFTVSCILTKLRILENIEDILKLRLKPCAFLSDIWGKSILFIFYQMSWNFAWKYFNLFSSDQRIQIFDIFGIFCINNENLQNMSRLIDKRQISPVLIFVVTWGAIGDSFAPNLSLIGYDKLLCYQHLLAHLIVFSSTEFIKLMKFQFLFALIK